MEIIWLLITIVIVALSFYYFKKANLNPPQQEQPATTETPINNPEQSETLEDMSAPNPNDAPVGGPSIEGIR